ncbi:hypothetical protein BDA96_08G189700 [Sorghum bicolor]|uniref:Uncharacterized protein n=1 Tax=Sorghum bicolor TaxID=4558 RepID=A0A921QJS1_SORBI|nr:hypothetical protein BDA96_08G189700 [Sorghum bicolor]
MVSPPWNNFVRSLPRFIVVRCGHEVRSGHDEGLGRINFRSVFLILQWQKEEEECWRLFVGHLFLGFCQVFACAVIHTAKRRIGLVLRSEAIHSLGTI